VSRPASEPSGLASFATTVQVRWGDVDPAGIAFYPRFFEWYDFGCEALFASLGLPWPEAFPRYDIVGVPIVESGSRFRSPVRYGEVLTIRSAVAWVKSKTFRVEHTIAVGDASARKASRSVPGSGALRRPAPRCTPGPSRTTSCAG